MTKIPSVRQTALRNSRSKGSAHAYCGPQNNMADSEHSEPRSELVTDAILEDQLVDIWQEYPCLYVRSSDFKNRDSREKAQQEIAEKLGQTGQYILNNILYIYINLD